MSMIDILLATYNGTRYLPDLFASLEGQSHSNWRLIVRDDGSTDGTASLIDEWAKEHSGRVRVIWDSRTRLGPCANFAALLEASEAPFFMFCDQDDWWLPDKVARLYAALQTAEAEHGQTTPIIVHTDLILADAELNPISSSFWRHQRLVWPQPKAPCKTLVLQNVVTGCAMIGNAALRKVSLPIPKEAIMHDWWLALNAAALGQLIADPKPSVLYRQHGANTLGANSWVLRDRFSRLVSSPMAEFCRIQQVLLSTRQQAVCLVDRHYEHIASETRNYLNEYGNLSEASFLRRKTFPFRHRLWFEDALRNIALVALI